jgi:hypothetical protein
LNKSAISVVEAARCEKIIAEKVAALLAANKFSTSDGPR